MLAWSSNLESVTLETFLGLINFDRSFLPNLSSILEPLHQLLSKGAWWSRAFQKIKELVTSAGVLVHFDPFKHIVFSCNASPCGIGAVLANRTSTGEDKVIVFASCQMMVAEENYSHLDKEAFALMFRVTMFHQCLWGKHFEAITEHKLLLGLRGADKGIPLQCSPRIQRWA